MDTKALIMNTSPNSNNGYMLIFRGTDWYQGLSPEQMQQIADRWMAWFNGLKENGQAVAGNPLEPQGKVVSGKNRVVSDGPFAESKEAVGGFIHVLVDTFEEAVEIAKSCPGLDLGGTIEIRPVLSECPVWKRAAARLNIERPPLPLASQLETLVYK